MISTFNVPPVPVLNLNPTPSPSQQSSSVSGSDLKNLLKFNLTRNSRITRLLDRSSKLLTLQRLFLHGAKDRCTQRVRRFTEDTQRRRAKISELRDRDVSLLLRRGEATTTCQAVYDGQLRDLNYSLSVTTADQRKQISAHTIFAFLVRAKRATLFDAMLNFFDVSFPRFAAELPTARFRDFVVSDHRGLLRRLAELRVQRRAQAEAAAGVFELVKAGTRLLVRVLIGNQRRQQFSALSAVGSLRIK